MLRPALLAAPLFALLAVAFPPPARADGAPQKVLRVVPSADPQELDPTKGANLISRTYSQMVFDTLFALDSHLAPKPMMVESEQISPDGLSYSFTLRPGLKFTDGSPVTSRDVVATLNRWMGNTSIGGQLKARLAALDVVDDRSFKLTLNQRFGLVEFMLAGAGAPIAGIMREADANRPATVQITDPVGSGPFRYVASERESGHRTVFERNPYYIPRSEPPDGLAGARVVKVDRVEWLVMPDATTAADALIKGEVDFWDTVNPDLAAMLRQHGITVRRTAALPTVAFIRPNFALPPFNDVRAREALALLFDQDEMMEAAAGEGVPWRDCWSFSVCGGPYGTEVGSAPYHKPDMAKVKQLLAEAGYHGEKIVLLGTPQLPAISAMTQVAFQRLKDAGMNVDLQMTDFAVMFQRIQTPGKPLDQGGYNLFAYHAVGGMWFHPLMNLSVDLSCGGRNWAGFPCDPQGEALRQTFLAAPDDAARQVAFDAFQKRLWQFIPYVPVGQFDVVNAWGKNVSGVLDAYFVTYWNIDKN